MTQNISEAEAGSGRRIRNLLIAMVAIALGITIFLGTLFKANSASLEAQAEKSVPLEVAFNNGKPTLIEFYANWCTTCQAMAEDLGKLKDKYAESVNFVMLNVDNSKWLPEVLEYKVDGIPQFVFFNDKKEVVAQTVGEQPYSILDGDLNALVADLPLTENNTKGQTSNFNPPVTTTKASQSDPRSHSAQVKEVRSQKLEVRS